MIFLHHLCFSTPSRFSTRSKIRHYFENKVEINKKQKVYTLTGTCHQTDSVAPGRQAGHSDLQHSTHLPVAGRGTENLRLLLKERGGPGQSCWPGRGKGRERVLWLPSSFFVRLPACTLGTRTRDKLLLRAALSEASHFVRDAHSGSVMASHPSPAQCRAGVARRGRSRWMLLQQNRRGQEK